MAHLGTHFAIGDSLLIAAQTKNTTGTPTDADSLPTYQIYEQGGTTALSSGSFAKRDDANTTGYYEASVTLTAAAGYEAGKQYIVRKLATVSDQDGIALDTFKVANAGATSFAGIAGWPTIVDVQTRLDEMGLTAPGDDTIEAAISAAVGAWEQATGHFPFLGTGTDATFCRAVKGRHSEGQLIDFECGITDEPTSLTVGGYYDENGAYSGGTALVINRDFDLYPEDAIERGEPYTYCVVHRDYLSSRTKIVAPKGYAETVPALAWESVMLEILLRLTPQLMIAESGGADSIKQGPVEWKYGSGGSMGTAGELMSSQSRMAAWGYRLVKVP